MRSVGEFEGFCYELFPTPRIEVPKFLITAAIAFLQFTISRNVRQSLPDNDDIPEEVVGLSCVLHRKFIGRRWKNICARRLTLEE